MTTISMRHRIDTLLTGRAAPVTLPDGIPGVAGALTGIAKQPSRHGLWLRPDGLHGDEQGDRVYHGGPEKALHHYAFEHYAAWRARFPGAAVLAQAGAFGENVSTTGMTERDVCIGDVFRCGDVLLQVSQARQPCWKLNVRLRDADAARTVQRSGHTGWYYRVLRAGILEPQAELVLVDRTQPEWPLARLLAALYDVERLTDGDAESDQFADDLARLRAEWLHAAALPELTQGWRDTFLRRVAHNAVEDWTMRLTGVRPAV